MSTSSTSSSSVLQTPTLATPFSPEPFCTQDIYYVVHQEMHCHYSNGSTVACRQFHLGPTTSTAACFPTSWSPSKGAFISPGGCPFGYTIACSDTKELEKTATCCPSGYSCQAQTKGFSWITTDLCRQSMARSIIYQYTTSSPGRGPLTTSTAGGNTLNAYGIAIRWRMADLVSETQRSIETKSTIPTPIPIIGTIETSIQIMTSLGITTSHESTPRTTTTMSSAITSTTVSPSFNNLPPTAKIGIGAGAAVAGILAIAGGFLLWKYWPTRRPKGGRAIIHELQPAEDSQPMRRPARELSELTGNNGLNTFGPISASSCHRGPVELPDR
ncbi:uncharacterized protein GGS22DRAFT_194981 [Annulohypoxylon maeteangense]|uniref:uncharacterized protein n=1 Tax=Annulohypoxylon maeteangense TaxID=1927788 RepID=UPI0020072A8C|nr:uncharacterized protein GGS22DRAFT_194981 [Annulohypoxylon maeteangense]KAI0883755.1 hypothetical protein GGS22DRAFT_194981 [Annulohypoxylon maeteangense]